MSRAALRQSVIRSSAVLLLMAPCGMAQATEYDVDTNSARQVVFVSEATIESFEGITDRIDGFVSIPYGALIADSSYDSSQFYFEVDLNSLDTGIGLRNRHMRENYLHTKKYPYASYTGEIESVERASDSTFLVACAGQMTIHGVTRDLRAVDTVVVRGGGYRVSVGFPIALPDYDIEIPKLMFLKINETVQLHLSFGLGPADEKVGETE